MYTLISIFYVSMLAMVTMIILKRREAATGKPSLFSKLGRGTDRFFSGLWRTLMRWISYINRHTFLAMAQWIAYHILLRIRNIYVELKHRALANPHGRRLIDAVRGRGEIRHHGASFYLRRIGGKKVE